MRELAQDTIPRPLHSAVDDIAAALGTVALAPDLDLLLPRVVAEACDTLRCERCVLLEVRHGVLKHVAEAARRAGRGPLAPGLDGTTLSCRQPEARAIHTGQSIIVTPRKRPGALIAPFSARSYVVAPIRIDGTDGYVLLADGSDEVDRAILGAYATGVAGLIQREAARSVLARFRRDVSAQLYAMGDLVSGGDKTDLAAADVRPKSARGPSKFDQLLTRREHEIAELMAQGLGNRDIAAALIIAEGTVKSHVKHIFRKFHAKNRAQAVSRYLTLATHEP